MNDNPLIFILIALSFFTLCWLYGEWQKMNIALFTKNHTLYKAFCISLWKVQLIFRRYK